MEENIIFTLYFIKYQPYENVSNKVVDFNKMCIVCYIPVFL